MIGLSQRPCGLTVVSGELLEAERRLDALIVDWSRDWRATEYRFPPLIEAAHLDRLDYFKSFPHLATFAVALDDDGDNLAAFGDRELSADGAVDLTATAPVKHVLTPAACYHVYAELEGARLDGPAYVTTRNTCYRREAEYTPLERQWAFNMREIVCIGTDEEVQAFLTAASRRIDGLIRHLGIDAKWESATDPFFRPEKNPKFLFQKLEPVKHEVVFDGRLAIASTNFHRDYFGDAFSIQRNGTAAASGCVAFGLERWLSALRQTFGARPQDWPSVTEFQEAAIASAGA